LVISILLHGPVLRKCFLKAFVSVLLFIRRGRSGDGCKKINIFRFL